MRNLIILRGAPGCGKSTWIKENNLENYCLSADSIRLLIQSPVPTLEANGLAISQKNDTEVWKILFDLLEKRMERGELVIVDATHSRSTDFSRYNKLCAKYRYRRYFVDFSDVPIKECKLRNKSRENYKIVPESAIDKIYSRLTTQQKTSGWVELDKNLFRNEIELKCFNFDEYENIYVFGDIHSCFTPLDNFFKENPFSEKNFYIFCGDYLDRGKQHRQTLEFLIKLSNHKNVLFLTGNHEDHLLNYINGDLDKCSSTFKHKTLPAIKDVKHISDFVRKLGQCAYFTYHDEKYLISHAGVSYMPDELFTYATENFIKGVGNYQDDIDEIWKKNLSESNQEIIQIHGHRNITGGEGNKFSYNLEGNVEFGGDLRVLRINESGKEMLKYKNTDYVPEEEAEFNFTDEEMLSEFENSEDIIEKDLGNNIHSFNFSRKVFFNGTWNKLNTHARGLFVDMKSRGIVARSYEKFFNIEERQEVSIFNLMKIFKNKEIRGYRKENGYLGLVSLINDELHFFTKTTDSGDFVEWFKEIWNSKNINEEYLKEYLKEHNCTLIFEVIDIKNDPHIIKYDESDIILLDIINNTWKFDKKPYDEICEVADKAGITVKDWIYTWENEQEFLKWYKEECDENDLSQEHLEGVVIEAGNETHPFMVKIKFGYYRAWKSLRALADKVRKDHKIELSWLWSPVHNYFYDWLKKQNKETLEKDIITLRDEFEKEYKS